MTAECGPRSEPSDVENEGTFNTEDSNHSDTSDVNVDSPLDMTAKGDTFPQHNRLSFSINNILGHTDSEKIKPTALDPLLSTLSFMSPLGLAARAPYLSMYQSEGFKSFYPWHHLSLPQERPSSPHRDQSPHSDHSNEGEYNHLTCTPSFPKIFNGFQIWHMDLLHYMVFELTPLLSPLQSFERGEGG